MTYCNFSSSFKLETVKAGINKVDSQLQSGIERIHDSIDKILVKMFKNLDHDLQDGVTEEMMKHLKIVSENIVLIKNQMTFMVIKLLI